MKIVPFDTDENFEEYKKWYSFYHKKGLPSIFVCKNMMAVESDGEIMAAVMVNKVENSDICFFTYLCRNPFVDREKSCEATDFLVKQFPVIAYVLGYTLFYSLISEEPAKARLIKNGFKHAGALDLFWGPAHV